MKTIIETSLHLIAEWDLEKNGDLLPHHLSYGSNKQVWWLCVLCGHSWSCALKLRKTRFCGDEACWRPRGLAKRAKQQLKTRITIEANFTVMEEWAWLENNFNGLFPNELLAYSSMKVWWRCRDFGHLWDATVNNRTQHRGCPYCANKKLLVGFNDLATTHPHLVQEWDERNELLPTEVIAGSNTHVAWRCGSCSHRWKALVTKRSYEGTGCPNCAKHVSKLESIVAAHLSKSYPHLVFLRNKRPLKDSNRKRFELDFWCDAAKLAFEIQDFATHDRLEEDVPTKFHGNGVKHGPTYHERKSRMAKDQGIRLLDLWEDEILNGDYKKIVAYAILD